MNDLRTGSVIPGKLYVGTTEVQKAYLGTKQVYGLDTPEPSASLSMTPATGSYANGATVQVTIRANSHATLVNGVTADFTYPTNRLTFQSIDASMSPFTVPLENSGADGEVKISRGILGDSTSGDQIVAVVTFTANAAGSTALAFTSDVMIADTATSSNICEAATGATYTIT